MREKFYRFMQGRYGNDQLNRFLMIIMALCLIVSFFAGNVFYMAGLLIFFSIYYRIFSKNIYKRSAENQRYLQLEGKVRSFFQSQFRMLGQRKTHHIYHCPSCKQKIRIPRGKGKIAIRCPKCGQEFVKHS